MKGTEADKSKFWGNIIYWLSKFSRSKMLIKDTTKNAYLLFYDRIEKIIEEEPKHEEVKEVKEAQ